MPPRAGSRPCLSRHRTTCSAGPRGSRRLWGMKPLKIMITAALVLGASACGASGAGSSGASVTVCMVALYGTSGTTQILFSGPGSDQACAETQSALSSTGYQWTQTSGAPSQIYPLGCTLHDSAGGTAEVESSVDAGGTCDEMKAISGLGWH